MLHKNLEIPEMTNVGKNHGPKELIITQNTTKLETRLKKNLFWTFSKSLSIVFSCVNFLDNCSIRVRERLSCLLRTTRTVISRTANTDSATSFIRELPSSKQQQKKQLININDKKFFPIAPPPFLKTAEYFIISLSYPKTKQTNKKMESQNRTTKLKDTERKTRKT